MPPFTERRKYRRFEIPSGEARHKRSTLSSFLKKESKPFPVLNIGMGGVAIMCKDEFKVGEEVILKLSAPKEKPLHLFSKLIWQGPVLLSSDNVTGFQFLPFSDEKGNNNSEALNVLRRLYARYSKDEKDR